MMRKRDSRTTFYYHERYSGMYSDPTGGKDIIQNRRDQSRFNGRVTGMVMILLVSLLSCSDQLTQQERLVTIPNQAWTEAYKPWIHLAIQDSTVPYRIYAVVRHTQQFKYNNLLLRYGYIAPGDSVIFHEVNLPLAQNEKWLGDTLGTVVETRVRLTPAPQKLPVGENVFVLTHLMPDQPLTGILQMGIRIEAADRESERDHNIPSAVKATTTKPVGSDTTTGTTTSSATEPR